MTAAALRRHVADLGRCARCPGMAGKPVPPPAVVSRVLLVGQAPGPREEALGRPFAWTAGRTLFAWFARLGPDEAAVRARCYISAVCRCFPGKAPGGGDRVPGREEIAACSGWMRREVELLAPELVIPIGRLAIERFLPPAPLDALIGRSWRIDAFGHATDCIPLPHPSGASTWPKREPGVTLLAQALALIGEHAAWRREFARRSDVDASATHGAPAARRPERRGHGAER